MDSARQQVYDFINDDSVAMEIFLGILICFVIYVFVYIVQLLIYKVKSNKNDSPVILSGLVDAQHAHEVKQDPNDSASKTLFRSVNENGIEYTYSMWLFINGTTWEKNTTRWKHVMHKGPRIDQMYDSGDEPHKLVEIQSPGLWIHPNSNTLRLYVNTYDSNQEYVEISNLPVKKWIHFTYTQSNFTSNVYINGHLKTTHTLATLPRQNYYNLWLTQDGGFNGYLSTTQYFNYVLSPGMINDMSNKGPTLAKHKEENESDDSEDLSGNLPYLSNRWWVHDSTFN